MKVGFIGLGRMGQAMTRRLLEAGHEVGVYHRIAGKIKPYRRRRRGGRLDQGGGDFRRRGVHDGVGRRRGVRGRHRAGRYQGIAAERRNSYPRGTHSVAAIEKLAAIHAGAGQVLIATPVLGRPEAVVGGAAGILVGGPPPSVEHCRPLFAAIAGRVVDAGADPVTAAAIKVANNFVLGCAIEAMGEGFSLVRKYGVAPDVFYRVLTEGPFACWAYKTYGQFIAEERYLPAGQRAVNGLKDANLALAAGEAKGVPLPSGNVWRDRLVGAVAHGEGEHDGP